jgi:hypothetical protein
MTGVFEREESSHLRANAMSRRRSHARCDRIRRLGTGRYVAATPAAPPAYIAAHLIDQRIQSRRTTATRPARAAG